MTELRTALQDPPDSPLPTPSHVLTIAGMNGTQPVSREEAKALWNALGPRMRGTSRLCDRMDRMGIDRKDPVRPAPYEAYNAIHALAVKSHYGSYEGCVVSRGGSSYPFNQPSVEHLTPL